MKKGEVAESLKIGIKGEAQKTSATLNFCTAKTVTYLYKTLKLPKIHKNKERMLAKP